MGKMTLNKPRIEILSQKDRVIFMPYGLWVARNTRDLKQACEEILKKTYPKFLIFDLSNLEGFDTSGVWLIQRTIKTFEDKKYKVELQNANKAFLNLSDQLNQFKPTFEKVHIHHSFFEDRLVNIGKAAQNLFNLTVNLIVFLGEIAVGTFDVLRNPRRLRMVSIFFHLEKFGLNAVLIISIISCALGLVLAFQGEEQLRRFGAEIYTINLVSISVVREVGILITGILVAGRTGSAITAEIGLMKINQEVDALNTFGLNPMEILIVPRILALAFIMPILAFISDIMGLLGGGIMVFVSLDVSPKLYIHRLGEAITIGSFCVGIMKAPFFGVIIGIVSCFEGMQVQGKAESMRTCTTRSVVESIFLVTIADALLSVFFTRIGI